MAPAPDASLPWFVQFLSHAYNLYLFPALPPQLQYVSSKLTPLLSSLCTSVLSSAAAGDFWGLFFTVAAIYIGVYTLNYIRRTLVSWIWFFVRLVTFAGLVATVVYVYNVGFETALEQAAHQAQWLLDDARGKIDAAVGGADQWESAVDALVERYGLTNNNNRNQEGLWSGVFGDRRPAPAKAPWKTSWRT